MESQIDSTSRKGPYIISILRIFKFSTMDRNIRDRCEMHNNVILFKTKCDDIFSSIIEIENYKIAF